MTKTKKQSKAKGIRSSINLGSSKGKLILFLLIFAVVGGGYMLYSSYAASNEIVKYTDKMGRDFDCYRGDFLPIHCDPLKPIPYPKIVTESSGSKSGLKVYEAGQYGMLKAEYTVTPWVNLRFSTCASVRNPGTIGADFTVSTTAFLGGKMINFPDQHYALGPGSTYTDNHCASKYLNATKSSYNVYQTIYVNSGKIRVSYMKIKW